MLLKHYLDRGVSKAELSRRFGVNRRTIHNWVDTGQLDRDLAAGARGYSPRPPVAHKLDPYKAIIDARLEAFPKLSAKRLFDEVRAADYPGCYSRVNDYVRATRPREPVESLVRFEMPAGRQGQVDFGTFTLPWGRRHALVIVLGYSRLLWLHFYTRQTMPVLMEGLESAFDRFRWAANDNAFARIAGEIRHAVIGWRHGAAVDAFAAERSEVLAAWGELRERTRAEGGTVALSPAFRETLDRHAALLKQASPFRTRPRTYERLLGERAGIGKQDLDEFEALHARAGKYRRTAMLKTAQALREEKARTQDEGRVHTAPSEQPVAVETMPGMTPANAVMQPDTPAQAQPDSAEAARQDAREAYEALNRDWDRHLVRADRGRHPRHLCGGLRCPSSAHGSTGR